MLTNKVGYSTKAVLLAGFCALSLTPGASMASAEEISSEGKALEAAIKDIAPESLQSIAVVDDSQEAVTYEGDGVTAKVPLDPEDDITLTSEAGSISVGLPFSSEAKGIETPSPGVVAFDNGNSSHSVVVVHDDGSVQVNTLINNESAPDKYVYPLTLPQGASLNKLETGQVQIIGSDGAELGFIDAPWAKDAAGTDVPTSYDVTGGILTQLVDHSDTYQYPIVADPVILVTKYEYKYVNITKTPNWVNKKQQLGICKILPGAANGRCTISNSYTSKTEISASFGLSNANVAAGIGINYSQEAKGSVSWPSAKAPVGSTYKAWAVGTRTTYKIQKWSVSGPAGLSIGQTRSLVSTSGTLAAFSPIKGFAVGQ